MQEMTLEELQKNENVRTLDYEGAAVFKYATFKSEFDLQVFITSHIISFVLQGTKIIRGAQGEFRLQEGDIFFFQKGNYLMSEIVLDDNKKYESLNFMLRDDFLSEFVMNNPGLFENSPKGQVATHLLLKSSPFIKSSLESIFPYFHYDNKQSLHLIKLKFNELLFHLIDIDKTGEFRNTIKILSNDDKKDLKLYMEKNFTQPYTVEYFAKNTFRSLTTFKKDFQNLFGTSPKSWINKKRLERAQLLLNATPYPISEISFLVGFENYSHFIQLFKKKYGTTPKQFRLNA